MTKNLRPFQEWLLARLNPNKSWRQHSLEAGMSEVAISRFMRGSYPGLESMEKLAEYLQVPRAEIERLVEISKALDWSADSNTSAIDDLEMDLRVLVFEMTPTQKEKLVRLARLILTDQI